MVFMMGSDDSQKQNEDGESQQEKQQDDDQEKQKQQQKGMFDWLIGGGQSKKKTKQEKKAEKQLLEKALKVANLVKKTQNIGKKITDGVSGAGQWLSTTLPGKIADIAVINPTKKAWDAAHKMADLGLAIGKQSNWWNPLDYGKVVWDGAKFADAGVQFGKSLIPLGMTALAVKKGATALKNNQAYKRYKQLQGVKQGQSIAQQLDQKYNFDKNIEVKVKQIPTVVQQINPVYQMSERAWNKVKNRVLENSSFRKDTQVKENLDTNPLILQIMGQSNPGIQKISDLVRKKQVAQSQNLIQKFGEISNPDNNALLEQIRSQQQEKKKQKDIKSSLEKLNEMRNKIKALK